MKKLFFSATILFTVLNGFAQSVAITNPVNADTALSVMNSGTGPVSSFVTKNTDNTGALFYGDHFGKGGGIKLRLMNAQNNNPAINISNYGNGSGILSSSNKSKAGEFYCNAGNTDTVVSIKHDGTGMGINVEINNSASPAPILNAVSKGVGQGVSINLNNPTNNNNALNVTSLGLGYVATLNAFNAESNSSVVKVNNAGSGSGVEIQMLNELANIPAIKVEQPSLYGVGLDIHQTNTASVATGINIYNLGFGNGINVTASQGNGIVAETNAAGIAAVLGINDLGDGMVGVSDVTGYSGVVGRNNAGGYGIRGYSFSGAGVLGQGGVNNSISNAGIFENINAENNSSVLIAKSNSNGILLDVRSNSLTGPSTVFKVNTQGTGNLAIFSQNNTNKVRIDNAGKGFFNGGTQSSGADMAEAFDVAGDIHNYEPGDVLMISTDKDRTVVKSNSAYTDLVVGVYATKPGMLMSEESIDADMSNKVPMGVVGVIPTKVCLEGGEIKRGDMLVTSSIAGVAMKADKTKIKTGQCIGKALENFNGDAIGKIRVFVNVK